jgi:hypothetical protein
MNFLQKLYFMKYQKNRTRLFVNKSSIFWLVLKSASLSSNSIAQKSYASWQNQFLPSVVLLRWVKTMLRSKITTLHKEVVLNSAAIKDCYQKAQLCCAKLR